MQIKSDFHDYYDCIQREGQDTGLIYVRKPVEVTGYPFPRLRLGRSYRSFGELVIEQRIIGFCGKIYPLLVCWRFSIEGKTYCYDLEDVDSFMELHFKEKEVEKYREKNKRWRWRRGIRFDIEAFFTECASVQGNFKDLFIDNLSPLFVTEPNSWRKPGKIVFNVELKQYGFMRIMDTYSAFQEIAMFFGVLAEPRRPIPAISDKDMVGIKGFDKFSFRKAPSKKRR